MKREDFAEIVNSVAQSESKRMLEKFNREREEEKEFKMEHIIAFFAAEITTVAARTTTEIIDKAGLIHYDEE